MKQILNYYFLLISLFLASCNGQKAPENTNNSAKEPTTVPKAAFDIDLFKANITTRLDKNIRCIFQDQNGMYWFGTNGAGVYRYDGKTLIQLTVKDGLSNNQVLSIQEDESGNMWFGTGLFGVSRFDGQAFTTFTNETNLQLSNSGGKEWKSAPNDLWFYAGGGVYRYNGSKLVYLPLDNTGFDAAYSPTSPFNLSRFAVYCVLKDTKGHLWFGTQAQGVCRYDGKSFTWFTEKGLAGPAVLGLFEDKNGHIWFGNNGGGLFRYDGTTLSNFTTENGLGNEAFRLSGKSGPGTLARIYAINEDTDGHLWVGTVDAGVWRYDGKNLTHYTTKDGLASNAVNTIYKDKNGELWFGTDADGICRFDGKIFQRFEIK